jgi:dsRNA-specific ribonuclease
MFNEVSGDLKVVTNSMGKMAHAMEHQAVIHEKAMSEDPQQKLRERVVNEVQRLEFTGDEVIVAALVFVKMPDQMGMLFALLESLKREYIVNMLCGIF